ncbi:MAG: YdcF family protein [Polyangiaceae bacterium]
MRAPLAIVVLGCRIDPSGRPGAAATRRADAALRAFRAGLAPRIVASGGRRWPLRGALRDGGAPRSVAEASAMSRYLVAEGAPESALFRELASMNTAENAIYTRALLQRITGDRAPHARVFVATCAWHLPRALEAFRRAGFDPTGLPAGAHTSLVQRAALIAHELLSTRLDRGRAALGSFQGAGHLGGDDS